MHYWDKFREGTNQPDDVWPVSDVAAAVDDYAERHGHTTIWWGVRQALHSLTAEVAALRSAAEERQAQHDATNAFHRDRVAEADRARLLAEAEADALRLEVARLRS